MSMTVTVLALLHRLTRTMLLMVIVPRPLLQRGRGSVAQESGGAMQGKLSGPRESFPPPNRASA